MPGFFLDRYELLCPLADGGMASVWVARLRGKHGFEKLVAIKTILPQYAADERFQEMFLDEARIASRIEHANVAQILDVGEQHEITYLVMEWVDGDSLSRLYRALKKKNVALPLNVLLRIVADACGGLHAAHELKDEHGALLGVVHRDVSPQNILVSQRGVAKLIDFGIAKARDRVIVDTNAGLLKGKIHYMAPEQALGNFVDRRADVFAVGALLHHMLSGAPPFDGPNQLAVLNRLTSNAPPSPLPETVPHVVAAIVKRSLAFSPDDRFATAADLQHAIESAMFEAKLSCTQAEVAAFVGEHGASRTASRKEAIDLALSAAAERARVRKLLRPNPDKSATGVLASSENFQSSGVVTLGERSTSDFPSSIPPPPVTPEAPIEVVLVDAPANKVKIAAIVVAVLVLIGIASAIAFAFGQRGTHSPAAIVATSKPTVTALAAQPTPPSIATTTSDIPVIDPESLPLAATNAPPAPTLTVHAAAPPSVTASVRPAPTATTTNRRSTYGF
jgi:serine/threonine-protein kinase